MSEYAYKALLEEVIDCGKESIDRTGVGTYSLFGATIKYNLHKAFPLFTAKKLDFKNIASELLWFISGSTNVYDLSELKTGGNRSKKTIWHDNAFADYWDKHKRFDGDVGKIYGEQWRQWPAFNPSSPPIDQIKELEQGVISNPHSRRHILQSYSPSQTCVQASIPACHCMAQFYVEDTYLDCCFYMRSNDLFLGHPYNVASYALLTYMLGHVTGLTPRELTFMGGDVHVYKNHLEAVSAYINSKVYTPPKLYIAGKHSSITDFTMDSFILENYTPGPVISAPMAV